MHSQEFIKAINQAASELGITTEHFPTNWAVKLVRGNDIRFIVGYTLPLNNSASYKIARSKNLCSEILNSKEIKNVPHQLLLTPTVLLRRKNENGNRKIIQQFISEYKYPFLIKRNNSSKGDGVFLIQNETELEHILSEVYSTDSTLCLSPYRKIISEFRNIVLNNKCLLSYEKKIPYISGDGKSLIIELLTEYLKEYGDTKANPDNLFDESLLKRLKEIPKKNDKIFLHWKHNASFGTDYEVVNNESMKLMAVKAAQAINARFVSVDIVYSDEYGFEVLEINASVVLNAFSAVCSENFKLTVEIFKDALIETFASNN
jgi:D-alanine-D-alanine ligase-like ATP-grasp enzyme